MTVFTSRGTQTPCVLSDDNFHGEALIEVNTEITMGLTSRGAGVSYVSSDGPSWWRSD